MLSPNLFCHFYVKKPKIIITQSVPILQWTKIICAMDYSTMFTDFYLHDMQRIH